MINIEQLFSEKVSPSLYQWRDNPNPNWVDISAVPLNERKSFIIDYALDRIEWTDPNQTVSKQQLLTYWDEMDVSVNKWDTYQTALSNGFNTDLGFNLSYGDSSRKEFHALYTLVKDSLAAGLITSDTPIKIEDKNEAPHTVAASGVLPLILRYGLTYKQIWDNRK